MKLVGTLVLHHRELPQKVWGFNKIICYLFMSCNWLKVTFGRYLELLELFYSSIKSQVGGTWSTEYLWFNKSGSTIFGQSLFCTLVFIFHQRHCRIWFDFNWNGLDFVLIHDDQGPWFTLLATITKVNLNLNWPKLIKAKKIDQGHV